MFSLTAKKAYPNQKPLMLKDFLLDDLSSCSSSGFGSFPRRQCCNTVRFLMDKDLRLSSKPLLSRTTKKLPAAFAKKSALISAASASKLSTFQRASEAVVNAVKHFHFKPSLAAKERPARPKKAILPRSLSRKLLKRSFWKKTSDSKEIEPWKPVHEYVQATPSPTTAAFATTESATKVTTTTTDYSNGSTRNYTWSDSSDFTCSDYLRSSSGISEINSSEKYSTAVVSKRHFPMENVGVVNSMDSTTTTSTTTTTSSAESTKNEWSSEEKEQFSPVSVLDCPFDDEEEVSSHFQESRSACVQGTKQKLIRKIQRLETLADIKPLDLETRISLFESDRESDSPRRSQSPSVGDNLELDKEENEIEDKAQDLVELTKAQILSNTYSSKFKLDATLLDFFRERITEKYEDKDSSIDGKTFDLELSDLARDWVNGQHNVMFLAWEVQKNKLPYLREMERGGRWKRLDEEKQEVALELEGEVYTNLVNELVCDLHHFGGF